MKATTYLVWKDPTCNGMNPEWVQLSRKQFHALVKSPECVGRYFERLGSTEAGGSDGRYVMETTEQRFKEYLKEKRHAQHLSDCNPGYQVVSYHELEIFDDCYGEELLCDDSCNVEAECMRLLGIEAVRAAVAELNDDERHIIEFFYYNECGTERDYADLIGTTKSSVNRRKQAVLRKLKNFLSD